MVRLNTIDLHFSINFPKLLPLFRRSACEVGWELGELNQVQGDAQLLRQWACNAHPAASVGTVGVAFHPFPPRGDLEGGYAEVEREGQRPRVQLGGRSVDDIAQDSHVVHEEHGRSIFEQVWPTEDRTDRA